MKRLLLVTAVLALLCAGVAVQAATWTFTNAADYSLNNAVVTQLPVGGHAVVASVPLTESASVFALVNTQLPGLKVGDITGGGFTLSAIGDPTAVYGSLYLSPTGGSGSNVMINISPVVPTVSGGNYIYTFDLNTAANVKIGPANNWGVAPYTGTFGGAITWVNASVYSNDYAAFFGPQASDMRTLSTPFTVTQIQLNTAAVPEPMSILLGIMGLGSIAGFRKLRRK